MTREELNYIKDAFSQIIDDITGNPDWYEAARAVASDLGTLERELGKKVASLPSNLDEAAEAYFYRNWSDGSLDIKPQVIEDFKAGAECMAGQGVNADFEVCKLANRAWLTPIDEKRFMQDVYGNFAAGDKVVVQIRKK